MVRMVLHRALARSRAVSDFDAPGGQGVFDQVVAKPSQRVRSAAADEDEVLALARRWRQGFEDRHWSSWPVREAREVVAAVLSGVRNGPEAVLHDAGQRWGRVQRDTDTLTESVAVLSQILVEGRHEDPDAVHRVLDSVVASAALALSHRLEVDSRTDALTGVGNRRAFDESLTAALAAASRQHHGLSLFIVDIDGMKHINDCEGHEAGDRALVTFAQAVRAALRAEDSIYRLGGDEFAILMPYCSAARPEAFMDRIQRTGAPAFSWGVVTFPEDGADARSLVATADAAMYRHKARSSGRIPRPAVV